MVGNMMSTASVLEQKYQPLFTPRYRSHNYEMAAHAGGQLTGSVNHTSLYSVIEDGNKFDTDDLEGMWTFHIEGIEEVVGFMRDSIQKEMFWDQRTFVLNEVEKTIVLRPLMRPGDSAAAASKKALEELCMINHWRFDHCLTKWLRGPRDTRIYHCIHNTHPEWQDLGIPLPARGLFGVLTLGVHLNVYTVKTVNGREEIDKIWVCHRAAGEELAYSGMLDQPVAGGLEPVDRVDGKFAPFVTLKREAFEEAGMDLDLETKTMTFLEGWRRKTLGTVESASYITYYDCKDRSAGCHSQGHLEPGVRFLYDLKLADPSFQLKGREVNIEKFETYTVEQVKEQLRCKRWKPNCALVMLDFLVRKGLVSDSNDDRFQDIKEGLRMDLPFKYVKDGFPVLEQ